MCKILKVMTMRRSGGRREGILHLEPHGCALCRKGRRMKGENGDGFLGYQRSQDRTSELTGQPGRLERVA